MARLRRGQAVRAQPARGGAKPREGGQPREHGDLQAKQRAPQASLGETDSRPGRATLARRPGWCTCESCRCCPLLRAGAAWPWKGGKACNGLGALLPLAQAIEADLVGPGLTIREMVDELQEQARLEQAERSLARAQWAEDNARR